MAVAELRVQPLPGLGDKAEQRMPSNLAGVDAARALPGADRAVVLDVARVQIERQRRPATEQRVDAGEDGTKRAVELPDVAEVEAGEEAPERRRIGDGVTP